MKIIFHYEASNISEVNIEISSKTSTKHTEIERFENILGSPGKFSKNTRGSIIKNEWIKAIDFCVYRLIEIITSSLLTHSTNFRRSFLRLHSIDGLDPFSPANFSLSVFWSSFSSEIVWSPVCSFPLVFFLFSSARCRTRFPSVCRFDIYVYSRHWHRSAATLSR